MMQMHKLGSNKFREFFKDSIQFWPNSRTFKALKMKQFFFQVFSRMWEPCFIFLYYGASVPWITSVNNFQLVTNILETMSPRNMYYVSLERFFAVLLLVFVAYKIHAEMTEILPVKDWKFLYSLLPMHFGSHVHVLLSNIDLFYS